MRELPPSAWQQVVARLKAGREPTEPVLPAHLTYRGRLPGRQDYLLCDDTLLRLQQWLRAHKSSTVYFFLTETVGTPRDPGDVALQLEELDEATLRALNPGFKCLLTDPQLTWGIFVDDEGIAHVAGPEDLYVSLSGVAP